MSTSTGHHNAPPDAVYRITFGGGINLPPGALACVGGTLIGAGQEDGLYEGYGTFDPASGNTTLDIGTRVPRAFPFATGLKAGPAGSSLRFSATGALPASAAITFPIDVVGHRGTMTLELVHDLGRLDRTAGSLHPDAFPDGLYRVLSGGVSSTSKAVFLLCAGRVCGSGEMGGRYVGSYRFDPIRKATHIDVTGHFPPSSPMVVGGVIGQDWIQAPIKIEAKFVPNGRSRFSYALFGRAVDAEVTLVRRLQP